MKISYAITVCNELDELKRLIEFLLLHKRIEDEIVIVWDQKEENEEVVDYLQATNQNFSGFDFRGDFSDLKNFTNHMCKGDFIFQIDADEMPNEQMIHALPDLLEANPKVDVFCVPRINTVSGLTLEHIDKWRWRVDEQGRVNFPDYQWRLYRRSVDIRWKNKVHEVLDGYSVMTQLPPELEWCLFHHKTIEKQEQQNNYYNTL